MRVFLDTNEMSNNRHKALFAAIATATLLTAACGTKGGKTSENSKADSTGQQLPGDSMVYGLACDGSTDTILVLLRDIEGDPDTFDILDASRNQQVFGRAKIGDQIGVVLAADSSNVAAMVIDIDEMKGSWCYLVTPTLRKRADVSKEMEQEFLKKMPDSVMRRLLQPREYGFELKNDHQAQPIGIIRRGNTTDDRSMVEFPETKHYREWKFLNGRLILNETRRDSLGEQQLVSSDTADLVMLRRDTLVLRFADKEQGYYRKKQ